jgi:hypothetical protein
MFPCTTCGSHVRATDGACPTCGGAPRRGSTVHATAAALLLGLAACTGSTTDKTTHSGGTTPQPEYGVTVTDTVTDYMTTDTTTDTVTKPTESGGTGAHSAN